MTEFKWITPNLNIFEYNPPSTICDMIKLWHVPPRAQLRRLEIIVTLEETRRRGVKTMRCNFATELKVDIDVTDEKLYKAFMDLVVLKAKEIYGVAGMLAKEPPIIVMTVTSRKGRETIPLFDAPLQDMGDDDSGE